jgi:hypothetical protein
MIAPALVAEVERLLAEGKLSQRAIARLTRISRGTIGCIAAGRRPDYEILAAADDEEQPAGPPQRCPGCGGLVYMPCRLCRVRNLHANHPRSRLESRHAEPALWPRLELRGEHLIRYRQVRAWRRQALGTVPFVGNALPDTAAAAPNDASRGLTTLVLGLGSSPPRAKSKSEVPSPKSQDQNPNQPHHP